MQELLDSFVPCADEVWRLQRAETAAARLFQAFCEEGHYAGREKPTDTRQGIYAVTPSGRLLTSWNTRNLDHVKSKMREALADWEDLDDAARYPSEELVAGPRPEDHYPEDGLVLQVFTRDLPREGDGQREDWRREAWNVDHLWLRKEEAAELAAKGLTADAANRLVRLHGRDNVRGQSRRYPREAVTRAELTTTNEKATGPSRRVQLRGYGAVSEAGEWSINDRHDGPAEHVRSFEGPMLGRAVFDATTSRFTQFELAWVGLRRGATQYNGRADDPGPAPMAVVFVLAPPGDRVAPSWFWDYGWR
ncbi:MAG: hypothetical protein AAGB93_16280 [Planctomycetota bacterium]